MRIIAVRAGEDPVIEELPDNSLETMQRFVGGWIEMVTLDRSLDGSIVLWCNEEGKLMGLPKNRYLSLQPDVICGDFFISAVDNDGETVGLSESEADWWREEISTWRKP